MSRLIPIVLSELQVRGLLEAANRADRSMVNARLRRAANKGAEKLEAALEGSLQREASARRLPEIPVG